MDKKMKVILAIVIVVIIAAAGVFFYLSTRDVTLEGTGAQVTLPNSFKLDNKGYASNGTVKVMMSGILGETNISTTFLNAIKASGNVSGYQNYTEKDINGYKAVEFAANPKDLKTLKSGSSTEWIEFPPEPIVDASGANVSCDHLREVNYVGPNNSTINKLVIYTDDPNVNLYTPEINKIVDSIHNKTE